MGGSDQGNSGGKGAIADTKGKYWDGWKNKEGCASDLLYKTRNADKRRMSDIQFF